MTCKLYDDDGDAIDGRKRWLEVDLHHPACCNLAAVLTRVYVMSD